MFTGVLMLSLPQATCFESTLVSAVGAVFLTTNLKTTRLTSGRGSRKTYEVLLHLSWVRSINREYPTTFGIKIALPSRSLTAGSMQACVTLAEAQDDATANNLQARYT